jgi:predicted DNA-binding transcriptional regulator AlpA
MIKLHDKGRRVVESYLTVSETAEYLAGKRSPMTPRPSTMPATLPALLSVSKAAEILGISRASAYRYAASGDLPTRRLGGRVYVVTARLMDIVEGEAA